MSSIHVNHFIMAFLEMHCKKKKNIKTKRKKNENSGFLKMVVLHTENMKPYMVLCGSGILHLLAHGHVTITPTALVVTPGQTFMGIGAWITAVVLFQSSILVRGRFV